MNHTQNLHLPQWEKTDRLMMDDFNDAFAAIDSALKAANDAVAATAAAAGNCQIVHGSYVGNGTYGSNKKNTLTFDGTPLLVAVTGRASFCAANGIEAIYTSSNVAASMIYFNWGNRSLSWSADSADHQLNLSGSSYYYVALIAKA